MTTDTRSVRCAVCHVPADEALAHDLAIRLGKHGRQSFLVELRSDTSIQALCAPGTIVLVVLTPAIIQSPHISGLRRMTGKKRGSLLLIVARPISRELLPSELAATSIVDLTEVTDRDPFEKVLLAVQRHFHVDAFICYAREDREFVSRLYDGLRTAGKSTWIDTRSIPLTSFWQEEIFAGIEAADDFLFILSPESIDPNSFCLRELAHAIARNKRLITILRRPVDDRAVPEELARIQRMPFSVDDEFETSIAQLVEALNTDLAARHAHTRLLLRSIDWERSLEASLLLRGRELKDAEELVARAEMRPVPVQLQFVLASREQATRDLRVKLGSISVAALAILFLGALAIVFALRFRSAAEERERQRLDAVRQGNAAEEARKVAVTAQTIAERERRSALENLAKSRARTAAVEGLRVLESDPAAALAFAVRSLELDPSDDGRRVLASAIVRRPARAEFALHPDQAEGKILFIPPGPQVIELRGLPGNVVAVHRPGDRLELRNADSGAVLDRFQMAAGSRLSPPWPSNRSMAFVAAGGQAVAILFAGGHRRSHRFGSEYDGVALAADGSTLLARDRAGRLDAIEVKTGAVRRLGVDARLSFAVSADGARYVALDGKGQLNTSRLNGGAGSTAQTTLHEPIIDVPTELALILDKEVPNQDANGVSFDPLELSGRATAIFAQVALARPDTRKLLEAIAASANQSMARRADESSLSQEDLNDAVRPSMAKLAAAVDELKGVRSCQFESTLFHEVDAALVWCQNPTLLSLQVWDLKSGTRAHRVSALMSLATPSIRQNAFAIAGPRSLGVYRLERSREGALHVVRQARWITTPEDRRLGAVRAVSFGPEGRLLVTVHSPFVLLQGGPPATVSLWQTAPVDARDGNTHMSAPVTPHTSVTTAVSFDTDGRGLVSYSTSGWIRHWMISSEQELFDAKGQFTKAATQSFFKGYRYLPASALQLLSTSFRNDAELIEAARRISRRALSKSEIERFQLHWPEGLPPPRRPNGTIAPLDRLIEQHTQIVRRSGG